MKFKGKFIKITTAGNYRCPIDKNECIGQLCMVWIDSKDLGMGCCGLIGTEQTVPNIAKKPAG